MTRVEKLEKDIMDLSRSELTAFSEWFTHYLAEEWDNQIETDAVAGKLDRFAHQALSDHQAGRAKRL